MQTTAQLQQGVVYQNLKNAIPIYNASNFYVEGGQVIPDNVNWYCGISTDGNYAIHNSEKFRLKTVINEQGEEVYVIKDSYNYITAYDSSNGKNLFFLNEVSAEANSFKFSLRLGTWSKVGCDDFYGNEKLLPYHSKQRIDSKNLKKFYDESDDYLIGLEIEKVDENLVQVGDAWEILANTGWSKECDGSLGQNGFEMVSPTLPLFKTEKIKEVCEPVLEWINSGSNVKCGGHITISKSDLTSRELLKSFKQFVPIIYALYPQRLNNTYCAAKVWKRLFSYNEKYQSFYMKDGNYTKGGMVEIRVPNRVRNIEVLLWRVQLIQYLIKEKCNLNQFAQKIGCTESWLYKHFAVQYSHEKIGEKLQLIDKYSKLYGTHSKGLSLSVKQRINTTMSYNVFDLTNHLS